MIQKLEMTVLIDNVAEEPLAGEWGLSILIIADGRKILLDTGSSDLFARNADCLGIDLGSVDIGVLSHAHYDHADGMETFFSLNRSAPFLVREGACENCFGVKEGMPMIRSLVSFKTRNAWANYHSAFCSDYSITREMQNVQGFWGC